MSLRLSLVALFLGSALAGPSLRAQVVRGGLVSQAAANRHGLQRVWFTQIELDRARGRVAHVTQHVSSTRAYTVLEITYDGGRIAFSERDLDRFGEAIGKDGARRRADAKVQELEGRKQNPKLATLVIPEITLYVITDRGVVQAVDGETGRTRWTTAVGNPNHPSEAPAVNDEYVAVVNGSDVYLLDQAEGQIIWRRQVRGAPGAGPAVSQRLVFVPMVDGAIESYQLEDPRQPPWVFKSHGRAVVQPIVAGLAVAWPTDRGHLYVAEANKTNILYRLETNKAIVCSATPLLPNRIVTASTDGYVYCIHESSGAVQWRFSTGVPIVLSPVVIGDSIYVITDDDSLFCITADFGREQWWAPRVRRFVAASNSRLYCLDDTGRLALLDRRSGARIGSLPTEVLDLSFVNRQTDRIFFGTDSGVIQCLREVQSHWPLIHVGAAEEEPAKPETKQQPLDKQPAAAPEKKPAVTDPFGGGSKGEKPFGGGAGADPFGGGKPSGGGAGADPFGGGSSGKKDDPFN